MDSLPTVAVLGGRPIRSRVDSDQGFPPNNGLVGSNQEFRPNNGSVGSIQGNPLNNGSVGCSPNTGRVGYDQGLPSNNSSVGSLIKDFAPTMAVLGGRRTVRQCSPLLPKTARSAPSERGEEGTPEKIVKTFT